MQLKIIRFLPLAVLLLFLPGCKHQGHEEHASAPLSLNNGQKWKANAATTEGIHKMEALVSDCLEKGSGLPELGDQLDNEFNSIIQQCTMTGEAHVQLHHFLLPLKEKINTLKENPDMNKAKEIQAYLRNYKNFFQ